jgi:6,7-dimethyl-8-ribityllumazine synthase
VSGEGSPEVEDLDASKLRVAIVATSWYAEITDQLLACAVRTCEAAGSTPSVVRVPGAFELPVVADRMCLDHDAVVALGLVVRGGTPHFDYVCSAATQGLTRVALDNGTAIGFGLLTCDTIEQARDRAGFPDSAEDKGREATLAAIETALLLQR